MIKIISAAITKTGRRRNNQDNFMLGGQCAECDHSVYSYKFEGKSSTPFFAAVCDGMGGEASGERASYEACMELAVVQDKLTKGFASNKKLVCDAILNANTRLCEIMQTEKNGRMGSTVISVLIQGDTLFYTNLGDSRIYLLRDGKLTQITKDHTEGQSMVDAGVLTAEQLKTHPSRNKLNRHLGIFPDEMVLDCPVYEDIPLQSGDRLLLCSDGVFGVFDNEAMAAILSEKTSAEERALKLVDTAYANGSKDNMAAMVIDIEKAAPDFLPIVYGVGALCLAALLFFAVKSIVKSKPGETVSTPEPTSEVTALPTEAVTEIPSEEPTAEPTEAVTPAPTDAPSPTDTPEPTQTITEPPSTEAPTSTSVPTQASTQTPTSAPTAVPTVTPAPTQAPTTAPASTPTPSPTNTPTPTEAPTDMPTPTESGNPNNG